MKTYSTALSNYRGALKEFYQVNLLSFKVRNRDDGSLRWYHFSSRDEDETIQVRNQSTGALEYRDYFGGGHIVACDPIVRSGGTTIRNMTITLSGTSPQVVDMLQGYDCRTAVFEWHIGEGEADTGLLVDTPVCEFDGFVDTANEADAAIDIDSGEPAESTFQVSVVSHFSALQRNNPDMRSYEIGMELSGDEIFLYADESNTWDILWGKKGRKHKKRNGGKGGRGKNDKPSADAPIERGGHR